jgi:hypothetical protein
MSDGGSFALVELGQIKERLFTGVNSLSLKTYIQ